MSAHVFRHEIISPGAARVILACVPLGIFSAFLWPGGADIAGVILTVAGVAILLRVPRLMVSLPFVLAGVWILFLLLMVVYASAWGAPGRPFKGFEKHLPFALGPPAAVALSVACYRLRFGFNELVAIFLAGLVAGALAMLIRAGALDLFADGWPHFSEADDSLGKLNRNYAALACGISLIAIAALIAFLSGAAHLTIIKRACAITVLMMVFIGECALLAALQSRMGYVATVISLAVWCGLMTWSVLRGAGGEWVLAVPIVVVIVALAGFTQYFPVIVERLGAEGTTEAYARGVLGLMRGHAIDSSSLMAVGNERLQLIVVALDLIRQRPWLGWGPDASQLIALFSPYPALRELNQFHNGYLQVLVNFGVVGGILIVALLASLTWSAFSRCHRASQDRLAPPLFAAMIALMAYILATSVAESIIFVKPVGFICMFLAALACMKDRVATAAVIGGRLTAHGQDESRVLR